MITLHAQTTSNNDGLYEGCATNPRHTTHLLAAISDETNQTLALARDRVEHSNAATGSGWQV